jgi:flagellar motility protein MotE (MotC chaperone)
VTNEERALVVAYQSTKDLKSAVVLDAYSKYSASMLKYKLKPRELKDILGVS